MALDLTLVGKTTEPYVHTYGWKDTVLYALGVGAKKDELDVLYEGRGPKVLPSFAVVPMFLPMFDVVRNSGGDLSMVVHGGQDVRVHKDLPAEAKVSTTATLKAVYDLKRFASLVIDTTTKDEAGTLIAETSSSIIFRGEGGFGGAPPPVDENAIKPPKDRPADFTVEEKTSEEQALLYRLSGDLNPLHADPQFAAQVGFERGPILHGLCTYGYMVRHVIKGACGGDPSRIKAFGAQFRKPVWPGDTLVTEGWLLEDGKISLKVSVKERNEAVLGSANAVIST